MPDPLVSQPTLTPTRKVGAGAIGGSLMTVMIGAAQYAGYEVPPELAAALATFLTFGVAYMTKDRL